MGRVSRQWAVGDGGTRGVRLVHSGGSIKWLNRIYPHPKLLPLTGELVFIEDFAGDGISVSQCLWTSHHFSKDGSPYAGKHICDL